jgi:hypothetical protein
MLKAHPSTPCLHGAIHNPSPDTASSGYIGSPVMALAWVTVLIAITLQTSFLTPPFGYALFFLRGSAPKNVRMQDIYKGIVPYGGRHAADRDPMRRLIPEGGDMASGTGAHA